MTDDNSQSTPPPPPSPEASEGTAPSPPEPSPSPEQTPTPPPPAAPAESAPPVAEPTPPASPEASPSAQGFGGTQTQGAAAPESEPKVEPASGEPQATPAPAPPIQQTNAHTWSAEDRLHAAATRARKKEERLAKILAHIRAHDRITNDEIEKLLHVSAATASRYTKILVVRGQLKQEGKGRGARYVFLK